MFDKFHFYFFRCQFNVSVLLIKCDMCKFISIPTIQFELIFANLYSFWSYKIYSISVVEAENWILNWKKQFKKQWPNWIALKVLVIMQGSHNQWQNYQKYHNWYNSIPMISQRCLHQLQIQPFQVIHLILNQSHTSRRDDASRALQQQLTNASLSK